MQQEHQLMQQEHHVLIHLQILRMYKHQGMNFHQQQLLVGCQKQLLHSVCFSEKISLNARALEAEFTDSPIDKIKVSNGQLASNHVLVGTTMLQKSSAMLATLSNWVLHSKQDENEV